MRTRDENDATNKEIAIITENNELNQSDEMVVYEVLSEYQGAPNSTQVLNSYPHIFFKLCDGEIINVENGHQIFSESLWLIAN